jgi:hypothetical protein
MDNEISPAPFRRHETPPILQSCARSLAVPLNKGFRFMLKKMPTARRNVVSKPRPETEIERLKRVLREIYRTDELVVDGCDEDFTPIVIKIKI